MRDILFLSIWAGIKVKLNGIVLIWISKAYGDVNWAQHECGGNIPKDLCLSYLYENIS